MTDTHPAVAPPDRARQRPGRRWAALGPAAVLLLLAGCGGGSSAAGSAAQQQPTPGASPAAGAAGTLSAGTSATSPGSQAPVPVESNPVGDIPDTVAFVPFRNDAAHYALTYPEGWARSSSGTAVQFQDKLDGLLVTPTSLHAPVTVASVRDHVVPELQRTQPAFELRSVASAPLPAGPAVLVVWRRNSPPDPVTGRQYRDEVRTYIATSSATAARPAVRLDLYGPVGADNVDAYRTISSSLRLT